jgi:2-C-methyl-D-erythritol 4-phosphate cytidylyltransferase
MVHERRAQETRVIAALILAGGQGIRFGARGQPKQFAEIDGKPLFISALRTYIDQPNVETAVLVANPAFMDATLSALRQFNLENHVEVARGGETRQASVCNGLSLLGELHKLQNDDVIILHNAASPNTPVDTVERCVAALANADVAQAYVPVLRTIFEMNGQQVGALLPRSTLACSCDPTVYRAPALRRVMQRQEEMGLCGDTTTDVALSLGMRIELVKSEQTNIKVTQRWDIDALKAAMRESEKTSESAD